ncbi:MAG TPA: response regulator [Vitreimonas sp.]|uniref:response regulator transcription factor n=1 Tax=Vitreimonas sp. TaxID=3069702 RepID=UPI002D3C130E|nr:response regulator [Vitreimonas sp.]HYD87473.1 response regulator [Vitreimonas sp.]
MSAADAAGNAVLRILVADGHLFQRRLLAETLRAGRGTIVDYAESAEQCAQTFSVIQPDILIVDWDLDGGHGLGLVQRIRKSQFGEHVKKLPIILVAPPRSSRDVALARNSGIDEFVIRPYTTGAMLERVAEVRDNRREFIDCASYVGPCRRRRVADENYTGPRRRLFDGADAKADTPDVKIRKGLARTYCERIGALMQQIKNDALDALRELCLAAGQLSALAADTKDPQLVAASSSLFNYVKGVGATANLNPSVVQAHIDAIIKLAELPNYQFEVRQAVTHELGLLVAKKLKQTRAA